MAEQDYIASLCATVWPSEGSSNASLSQQSNQSHVEPWSQTAVQEPPADATSPAR